MSNPILDALSKLDPKNDEHWTADKLPRLDAMGGTFKRQEVTRAAPNFNRDHPDLTPVPSAVETPVATPETKPAVAYGLESSEFGGASDEDDEPDEVDAPEPPSPEEQKELDQAAAKAAEDVAAKAAAVEAANADLERATAESDALKLAKEAMLPPAHLAQQATLMGYLHSTMKNPPPKAQIDKVMERKQGYGLRRPIFFPQQNPVKR